MTDIITALEALQDTPVPNILVVGGLVFLFLAVVGQFVGEIKVTPERQKMAGILGGLLLLSGIVLYVIPPSLPGLPAIPVPTVVESPSPRPSWAPTSSPLQIPTGIRKPTVTLAPTATVEPDYSPSPTVPDGPIRTPDPPPVSWIES